MTATRTPTHHRCAGALDGRPASRGHPRHRRARAEAGLHPELVRRFVDLGLLEPVRVPAATPLSRAMPPRGSRAHALRRDLGLSYAGAVLACELLARIDELEARLRRYEPPTTPEVTTWIRTS